jgi:hypothetical protein
MPTKENLIKFSLPTARIDKGTPDELANQAEGTGERHTKKTRRAAFLAEMNQVVPCHELCALIEPIIPRRATGGQLSG